MRYTPYYKVYPLLQGIPPIARNIPYCEVYPPIARYTPYYKVYPLLRGIPPITRYTPYCEVYPLLQGIPPIARYTPYCKIYMYYCSQNIPPISKHTPCYKVANFDTNYTPYVCAVRALLDVFTAKLPPQTLVVILITLVCTVHTAKVQNFMSFLYKIV